MNDPCPTTGRKNCPMCSGEVCRLCGAGCWNNSAPHCDHDVCERHQQPLGICKGLTRQLCTEWATSKCDKCGRATCDECACKCEHFEQQRAERLFCAQRDSDRACNELGRALRLCESLMDDEPIGDRARAMVRQLRDHVRTIAGSVGVNPLLATAWPLRETPEGSAMLSKALRRLRAGHWGYFEILVVLRASIDHQITKAQFDEAMVKVWPDYAWNPPADCDPRYVWEAAADTDDVCASCGGTGHGRADDTTTPDACALCTAVDPEDRPYECPAGCPDGGDWGDCAKETAT